MVIETYLDASSLSPSQTLVAVDDNGKRWDVLESMNASDSSSDGTSSRSSTPNTEVILERWKVELKCIPAEHTVDFGPSLPTIYKRSIVFFRSLFVTTRVMPAWRFSRQALVKNAHPSLEVKCRITTGDILGSGVDALRQPLFYGRDVVTDYMFGDLEVPVGRFYASVAYRNDCTFRVEDSESLLSSRFMGVEEQYFRPSLPQKADAGRRDSAGEIGSLPSRRHSRHLGEAQQQTYGSLSTFHGAGPLGTSPISALKAVRPIGSDTSSPPESAVASIEPEAPHSLPISGRSPVMRPSIRNLEGAGRRPSVSFQPFKAGALSGSPRIQDEAPPSPGTAARQFGMSALTQTRNRTSLTAGMAASLRGVPFAADPGQASSPKPTPSRYSSSFSHRRGRPSFGGTSRAEDDQGSSGKQSLSSSAAQPGSGLLAEGGGTSSGSFQTDDDNISEFLKLLDSKKTLQSFETSKTGESATKVTQLSKFQMMKDSNIALTESMNSSMHLHRSSSSSSRQLTSVPGMINPASMSASSSPSKPLSPHTPHTPAVPSRLSENSIIHYQGQAQAARVRAPEVTATEEVEETPVSQDGAAAIDIPLPLSPRLLQPNRRASSVAQQGRAAVEDEDPDAAFGGQRSISLGADDRELSPTLGGLFRREPDAERSADEVPPPADSRPTVRPRTSSSADREARMPPRGLMSNLSRSPHRPRYQAARSSGPERASSPPPASPVHFSGSSTARYGPSARGTGEGEADDEPFIFDMSEIGQGHGRRSVEEPRGSRGPGASSYADRGGYDSSRGSRRAGW